MTAVPLPRRLRALQKDKRGYPVPYTVFRDKLGAPHFAINDTEKAMRCKREGRCPICGYHLERLKWWIGGPGSAFHPEGAYNDSAMHSDCAHYALRVCPYLAIGRYTGRVDLGGLDLNLVEDNRLFLDITQDPARPAVFVAVAAQVQELLESGRVRPRRPYAHVEYWRNGEQLDAVEGERLAREALAAKEKQWQRERR